MPFEPDPLVLALLRRVDASLGPIAAGRPTHRRKGL
jgi:hypothetical protein